MDFSYFNRKATFQKLDQEKYDLIVIDPPTISRSKKMDQMFDIQLDYIMLIKKALKLLDRGGAIYFSTNSRRFVFDEKEFAECSILDVSSKTIPIDFHDPKIHRCWRSDKTDLGGNTQSPGPPAWIESYDKS